MTSRRARPTGIATPRRKRAGRRTATPTALANAPFLASSWTSAALNPNGQFTGRSAQLSVNYGTDPAAFGWGFHFDDVVLTNFQEAVPDAQACAIAPPDVRTTGKPRRSLGRT